MRDGRIAEYGTYQELLARGVDFHAALDASGSDSTQRLPEPEQLPTRPALSSAASASEMVPDAPSHEEVSATAAQPQSHPHQQPLIGVQIGAASDAQAFDLPSARSNFADSVPRGDGQPMMAPTEASQGAIADDGAAAAAAEQADQKALDLLPLLTPTVTGGATPEAASGALLVVAGRRGSEVEPRGWRGADGKLAGAAGAGRKGRLVYVRFQCLGRTLTMLTCK